jgi:hypothetical protein
MTWAEEKPPLGGWVPGVSFSQTRRLVIDGLADELIPGGDGFPAPSTAGITTFVGRYIAPRGNEARWYPFFAEEEFTDRLDRLADAVIDKDSASRIRLLQRLEAEDAEFFCRFRDLVYYGYYSRPAVVRAINETLVAGRGYRLAPQPFGYTDMPEWDAALLGRVRGGYTTTESVKPVDLSRLRLSHSGLAARRGESRGTHDAD